MSNCLKPAGPLTRKQRADAHRIRMTERRARQRSRQAGFTAVPNGRLNNRIQLSFAELMVEHADKIAAASVAIETLQESAVRKVARTLPAPPMVFDWRNGLPTRNNDAAYRK